MFCGVPFILPATRTQAETWYVAWRVSLSVMICADGEREPGVEAVVEVAVLDDVRTVHQILHKRAAGSQLGPRHG
jgi:hypothetical protein